MFLYLPRSNNAQFFFLNTGCFILNTAIYSVNKFKKITTFNFHAKLLATRKIRYYTYVDIHRIYSVNTMIVYNTKIALLWLSNRRQLPDGHIGVFFCPV